MPMNNPDLHTSHHAIGIFQVAACCGPLQWLDEKTHGVVERAGHAPKQTAECSILAKAGGLKVAAVAKY